MDRSQFTDRLSQRQHVSRPSRGRSGPKKYLSVVVLLQSLCSRCSIHQSQHNPSGEPSAGRGESCTAATVHHGQVCAPVHATTIPPLPVPYAHWASACRGAAGGWACVLSCDHGSYMAVSLFGDPICFMHPILELHARNNFVKASELS